VTGGTDTAETQMALHAPEGKGKGMERQSKYLTQFYLELKRLHRLV